MPKSLTKIQGIIFDDCTGIESIVVDEGNKVYDSRNGCNAIIETASGMLLAACSNAVIPEGVTGVGLGAFDYAENLKSIAIPKGVTRFESFPNNRVLESIVVEEGNSVYDSRGGCNAIIETATDILIAGCASTIIPQGIKAIGRGAFDGSKKLNEITIPDSVADIGEWAFFECSGLKSISIPYRVTAIKDFTFCHCSGITRVEIPGNIKTIGDYAFEGCTGIESVTIEQGLKSIGEEAFGSCNNLKHVTLPPGIEAIDKYAFLNCNSLVTISIPASEENHYRSMLPKKLHSAITVRE